MTEKTELLADLLKIEEAHKPFLTLWWIFDEVLRRPFHHAISVCLNAMLLHIHLQSRLDGVEYSKLDVPCEPLRTVAFQPGFPRIPGRLVDLTKNVSGQRKVSSWDYVELCWFSSSFDFALVGRYCHGSYWTSWRSSQTRGHIQTFRAQIDRGRFCEGRSNQAGQQIPESEHSWDRSRMHQGGHHKDPRLRYSSSSLW